MKIKKSNTVAELVAQNYKAADVFKKYNIDFCCGGRQSLATVCEQKKLAYSDLEEAFLDIDASVVETDDFINWELDRLIEYIVQTHHSYVRENIPQINAYAEKVARVHGENHPENIEVYKLFNLIASELMMHMNKEEHILFPFIVSLVKRKNNQVVEFNAPFNSIDAPISMMEHDHDNAGKLIKAIRELTNNYQSPTDACTTYKVLYAKLMEFESDLFKHIHLENNLLFPKAQEIERSFSN